MHTISNTVTRKFIDSIDLSDLEIETDSGWQPVTAIHKTVPYDVWIINTQSGLTLECADTHIVFDEHQHEIFVKDIKEGVTKILTKDGIDLVTNVVRKDFQENMFDVTVDHDDHRFYTNGILSHNTVMLNAISYAIYGQALTNIKKDNLVNKINGKGMLVTVSVEINGVDYRIERGRKPNVLKFTVNGNEQKPLDSDESQGDSRETQKAIEDVFKMSHDMFKHLVALNTYTEPFLSMKAGDQRNIIEQLLGITQLSEKAEALKVQLKSTKDLIATETTKLDTIKNSNEKIQQSIDSIHRKLRLWDDTKKKSIDDLNQQIEVLSQIDIEPEIENQRQLAHWSKTQKERSNLNSAIAKQLTAIDRESRLLENLNKELVDLNNHKCHACGNDIHNEQHELMVIDKTKQIVESSNTIADFQQEVNQLQSSLSALGDEMPCPIVIYDNIEYALNHKNTLESLHKELERKQQEVNPYSEQIADLKNTALQEISWDQVNKYVTLRDHQDFLLKLLTNKDSFVRKQIIDQNLAFLNQRLTFYLDKIGLPHLVEFQNDLSVVITQLGQDLDFGNLSRGEQNRLILSLSWAFINVSWVILLILFHFIIVI